MAIIILVHPNATSQRRQGFVTYEGVNLIYAERDSWLEFSP